MPESGLGRQECEEAHSTVKLGAGVKLLTVEASNTRQTGHFPGNADVWFRGMRRLALDTCMDRVLNIA